MRCLLVAGLLFGGTLGLIGGLLGWGRFGGSCSAGEAPNTPKPLLGIAPPSGGGRPLFPQHPRVPPSPPHRQGAAAGPFRAEMAAAFEHLGLDPRLLRAVSELGWAAPTAIQAEAIPAALEGRDLLARARTGSGKTAAYGLPLLHRLLRAAAPGAAAQAVRALVLVPSKELGQQVVLSLRRLAAFCARHVRVADICAHTDLAAQKPVLMERPEVVVGTPGRVLAHLEARSLVLRHSLELLVLDEADLLLSFGFGDDLKALLCHLPKIYQALLVSATFNPDVEALKELVLHNPVIVQPQEPRLPGSAQLQQWVVRCDTEEDKFLLLCALLKLALLRGRALLFVGALARCYRLKLFLEQFGIAACALNSELPARSRCHVITQFNRGLYDYIVATDEEALEAPVGQPPQKKRKGAADSKGKDPEYSVARGIDFQNVAAVINFDVPPTVESYIHRVGRTARADNPGTALTFVLPEERDRLAQIEDRLAGGQGGALSPRGGGHRVPRDIVGVSPRAPGARECPQGTSPCCVPRERRVHAAALQVLHGGDRGPAVPLPGERGRGRGGGRGGGGGAPSPALTPSPPGRHALRHQAGGEGGSAAGDQGGAAQLRETQGTPGTPRGLWGGRRVGTGCQEPPPDIPSPSPDVLRGQPPRPARPAPRQAAAPRHRQASPPQRARLPGYVPRPTAASGWRGGVGTQDPKTGRGVQGQGVPPESASPSDAPLHARSATQPPQHRQAQPEEAQAAAAVPRRCWPPRRPHGECGTVVTPPPPPRARGVPTCPLLFQGLTPLFSALTDTPQRQPTAELQVHPPAHQAPCHEVLLSPPCPPGGCARDHRSCLAAPLADGVSPCRPLRAAARNKGAGGLCQPCGGVLLLPGSAVPAGCVTVAGAQGW
uniref:RNA helicase n=1 Tax=Cairina moschata TaxID=8855 RepID=A0A8C3CHD2_CAIMO